MISKKQVFLLLSFSFSLYACESNQKKSLICKFFSQDTEKKQFFDFVTRPKVLQEQELLEIREHLDVEKSVVTTQLRKDVGCDSLFRAVTIHCVYTSQNVTLPNIVFGLVHDNNEVEFSKKD